MARDMSEWQTISLPIGRETYARARIAAATAGIPTVEFIRKAVTTALDELPSDPLKQAVDGIWDRLGGPGRATVYRVAMALDDAETFGHSKMSADELAALDQIIKDAAVELAQRHIDAANDSDDELWERER